MLQKNLACASPKRSTNAALRQLKQRNDLPGVDAQHDQNASFNLYEKLGVQRRTQAIQKAKSLRLIP